MAQTGVDPQTLLADGLRTGVPRRLSGTDHEDTLKHEARPGPAFVPAKVRVVQSEPLIRVWHVCGM